MSTRTSREEQVFADALERPPHERAAFLDGACRGDAALRDHKVLARSPSDLRALFVRSLTQNVLGLVEARRFHPELALKWAEKFSQSIDAYLSFEPSDAPAWRDRFLSRRQTAQATLAQGRVNDADKLLRAAIALQEKVPRRAAGRWPVPLLWFDLASAAARRGDRAAVEQALSQAAREQESQNAELGAGEIARLYHAESLEQIRRRARLYLREFAVVDQTTMEALVRIDALARHPAMPIGRIESIHALRYAAAIDSANAALRLGRNAEAENRARVATSGPLGNGQIENLETNRAFAQCIMALASFRQNSFDEARETIAAAIGVYRELQKNGAVGVDFNRDLAFCLYVQAHACRADDAGRAERERALGEAADLLRRLGEEAKALGDVRELIELIAAERAKQNNQS